jgi:Tetratricopeptide repeat
VSINVDNTAHTYPAVFCWLCLDGVFLATGQWVTSVHQAAQHPVLLALVVVVILVSSGLLVRGLERPALRYPLAVVATILTTAFILLFVQAIAGVGVIHFTALGRRFGLGTAVLTGVPLFFVAYTVAAIPIVLVADVVGKRRKAQVRAPLDAAIASAREGIVREPESAAAHMELARALSRKWSLESRTAPDAPDGFMNADYRQGQRDLEDAAAVEWSEAVRLAPDSVEARRELGFAYTRQEKVDDAIAELRKSLALADDVRARLVIGGLLEAKQDAQGAMAEYREVIRLHPEVAEAHHRLGMALKRAGDRASALPELLRAHELDPANREYNYDYDFLRREMNPPASARP